MCCVAALPEISGSQPVCDVAAITRPRYHFVSDIPVFFTRAPYINPDLGAGSHATRFISLAPYGIPNQKSLTALQLVPADQMDPKDRHALPVDSTQFPYQYKKVTSSKRPLEEEVGTHILCFSIKYTTVVFCSYFLSLRSNCRGCFYT